jgi:hypothetical protein
MLVEGRNAVREMPAVTCLKCQKALKKRLAIALNRERSGNCPFAI